MKILIIDIETTPHDVHLWSLHGEQHVGLSQLRRPTRMFCFAAKWYGEKKVMFHADKYDDPNAHYEMVAAAWSLLDEADVVMTFNGRKFDIPHLNREFVEWDLGPPAPYQQIDVWQAVSKRFRLASNKLDYVATWLGLGNKVSHEGHGLWVRCLEGDDKAWKLMEKYNRRDVTLLEEVYERLLPWIPNHPSRHVFDGHTNGCPTCGEETGLQRRGYYQTKGGRFLKFRCGGCGSYFRGTQRVGGSKVTEAIL